MAGQPTGGAGAATSSGTSNLGGAGAGLSLASGLISTYGALYAGQSQANALNAEADYALQNAQEAESQGHFDAIKEEIMANNKMGAITANYGASGVTSNSGSAQAVLVASTANSELDRLNILHGADVKAVQYENQAAMDKIGAQSALTGSKFQAAGTMISSGMRAASFGIAASPQSVQIAGLDGSQNLQQPQLGDAAGLNGSPHYLGGGGEMLPVNLGEGNSLYNAQSKYDSANNLNLSSAINPVNPNDGSWVDY